MGGFRIGDRILLTTDTHVHWIAAHGEVGAYRLVGASTVGQSHVDAGRPRDDAFAAHAVGPWLAVAVSDGVGSRPLSRYGSSFTVETLCEELIKSVQGAGTPSTALGSPAQASVPVPREAGGTTSLEAASPVLSNRAPSRWTVVRAATPDAPPEGEPTTPTSLAAASYAVESPPNASAEVPMPFATPDVLYFDPIRGDTSGTPLLAHGTFTWQPASAPVATQEVFEKSVCEEGILQAFQKTWDGLAQFAHDQEADIRNYSCTLLGLLLNTQTGQMALGHIGDGAIVGRRSEGTPQILLLPPSPGTPSEVFAFSRKDWQDYLTIRVLEPAKVAKFTTFFLMTDGVTDSCLHPPPDDILERWTGDIDREVRQDEPAQASVRLLQWLATYKQKGSRDDRTLVVIYRAQDPTYSPTHTPVTTDQAPVQNGEEGISQ